MRNSIPVLILLTTTGFLLNPVAGRSSSAQQTSAGSATEAQYRASAQSADQKFKHIQANGIQAQPDQTPTIFTEREINAYMNAGHIRLPKGVTHLRFSGFRGSITTDATVDFDQIVQGRRSSNPLLALFRGVHQVRVISHGEARGGAAQVHIDSASLDGVTVPRVALEYFAERYIKPKYPNLGVDSTVKLPNRIDTSTVGNHTLVVTQK